LLHSDEYDILPFVESTTNRNPVILVDHKLAVEAWAAQLMFCTAVSGLQQWQRTPVFNNEGNQNLPLFSLMLTVDRNFYHCQHCLLYSHGYHFEFNRQTV